MAADVSSKWRTIAIWALRVVLGLAFLAVGTTKLTGTGQTVEYFAAIGWGPWFRYLTGLLDIAGANALSIRGRRENSALSRFAGSNAVIMGSSLEFQGQ